MNIAFYVSGKATRLKKIVNDSRFDKIKKSIKLIFSDNIVNENLSDLKNIFSENVKGVQFDLLEDDKNFNLSKIMLDELLNNKIDYCFSFGDHILTANLVNEFENRIINFHPSILPMFPGRRAIDKALNQKIFLYGNTAHFVDSGIDTGPIIMQNIIHNSQIDINNKYDQILDHQIDMFYQIYKWLESGRVIVKDDECSILNCKNNKAVFFPELESK